MVHAQAGLIRDWPTDHLNRAYRLAVMDVHRALAGESPGELAASQEEAAMFAEELVRRGVL